MKKITLPLLFAVFTAFPISLFSQDNNKLIKDYISQNKTREYKKNDLTNFVIDNVDPSKSMSGEVVKFHQTYNGMPVYGTAGTVLIKDNKVVYYSDNFLKDYNGSTSATVGITKEAALQRIAEDLGNEEVSRLPIMNFFEKGPNKLTAAKQRLMYTADETQNLRLAYEYLVHVPKTSNHWNILVDAHTGKILSKLDLNLSCNFHDEAFAHGENTMASLPQIETAYPASNSNLVTLAPDNASYNVFPLPVESPTFGTRAIVNNPWLITSSPEGWHSNVTNHYTTTRGNNVYAYDDKDDDEDTFGISPDGGAARNFDFPYSSTALASANLSAATTNLFYISNKVHDIFYKFGFTESIRNFQSNNFGNGGLDDDEVFAQSQDGGGFNNANFASYPDNYNPVMQMYLWLGSNRKLFYNAPSDAVGRIVNAGVAQFGTPLNDVGITGDIKLASVIDGCAALPAGELAGKIGLVERGGVCGFSVKVKNTQNAGAIGTIIYNNTANGSTLINMGGTDATVTIPSILVTNAEGEYIKAKLAASTTVNVDLRVDAKYDGSFDNGIVTHEYGHGISNRMTGTGYNCLNSNADREQMGEGWSDFFALMVTNRPGDNASVPRGMGTYPIGQATTGGGIRPAKYSPDFAINGFTYGDTNGMEYANQNGVLVPDVHSIGFIWATMLWDLHWKYVEKYGYASEVTANATSGSARVLQLVTDALKLQACNPTFIDGRDAILQAEMATTAGVDKCMIWRVFAKRGLGTGATAGNKQNINDQTESFTLPEACAALSTEEVQAAKNKISIYPNPAKDEFYINFPGTTIGKVSLEIYDMSGKLVSSEDKISPDSKKAVSTNNLVNGTYMVKVKGLGFESTAKVIVKK
ncbi:T9SS-dependent M36 family metallopeptidase [Chryseobacterium sp. L7]|uniref:T9SS-dependent M36 family metallopeptidase n=1 Tax=Chryseobacterium endalhagicum TaxID=2797638 RepID=A0ABS1QJM5_9FLAO|nr:T9SS-dependent M36 family metallopeptidase [Chryseobacterium endalhagicum]MBL1222798.1 T9SS-dependent M36 family metallopeptidase [Chryseobacterium endalhagicum]